MRGDRAVIIVGQAVSVARVVSAETDRVYPVAEVPIIISDRPEPSLPPAFVFPLVVRERPVKDWEQRQHRRAKRVR